MIVAEPGSGKSTSIRNLNPETTFLINVYDKALPFRGWRSKYTEWDPKTRKGNYYSTDQTGLVLKLMQIVSDEMPHINALVIDDYQFLSAFEFMKRAEETGLNLVLYKSV